MNIELNKKIVKEIASFVLKETGVDISKSEEALLKSFEVPKLDIQELYEYQLTFVTFELSKQVYGTDKKKAKENQEKLEELTKKLGVHLTEVFQNDEVLKKFVGTGRYLNIYFKSEYIGKLLFKIDDGSLFNEVEKKKEKVMIEYSQPNTHKTFHVGHMRNASLGNCLIKLFEFQKYDVTAVNYIGDEGTHIAKCLWYYTYRAEKKSSNIEENIPKHLTKVEFLGDCYSKADNAISLSNFTKYPLAHVFTAKVEDIEEHKVEKKWKVVTVSLTKDEKYKVVCGGKGYQKDDIIAFAKVGAKINKKKIIKTDMKGVESEGMILSEVEFNASEEEEETDEKDKKKDKKKLEKDKIYLFPKDTPVGVEVVELGRFKKEELPSTIESEFIPEDVKIMDEIQKRQKQISEMLQKMENKDEEITKLWKLTREWSISDFKDIYKWSNCRFDHYFHESDVSEESKDIILKEFEKGNLIKENGAIFCDFGGKLEKFILLKSDGTGLYSTKDIALAKKKFEEFKIDKSIYVVDYAQTLHFKQVFATLEKLGFKQSANCYHLSYGQVVLPDGKMSSRKGNVIFFTQLKKQLEESIIKEFFTENSDKDKEKLKKKIEITYTEEEKKHIIHFLSVATIKYGMLNQDPSSNLIFNLKTWTAKTGNTGPYLLYAYTRICSIFKKAPRTNEDKINLSKLTNENEIKIINLLNLFMPTVQRAMETYKPHNICMFIYSLAKNFSRYYESIGKIKDEKDLELRATRLLLIDCLEKF